MKLAKLVGNVAKHLGNWLRIQGRTIGRDAPQRQAALLEGRLERAEQGLHVGLRGIMVQHLVGQAAEAVIVDDREDTEAAIVQLVRRDVSGELSQHGVQVRAHDVLLCLFSPPPSTQF